MSYRKLWVRLALFMSVNTYSHANQLMGQQAILNRVSRNSGDCFTKVDSYGGEDFLCISGSPKFPGRIAIMNKTTWSSVIIDSSSQQYAFLQKNGAGYILDEEPQLIYDIKGGGPWSTNIEAIPTLNLSDITKNEIPKDINWSIDSAAAYDVISAVVKDLDREDLSDHPAEGFFSMIRRKIQELMNLISTILMYIFTFNRHTWSIMRFGLTAFFNMIKWVGRFIAGAAGGVGALIHKSVKFPLRLISMAKNGIEVLAILIKSLADKFDLAATLKSILAFPMRVFNMIVGLGGEISRGISSVYSIISNLVKLVNFCLSHPWEAIMSLVRYIISKIQERILKYFINKPVQIEDYSSGSREIQQVIKEQDEKYGNGPILRSFANLLNPPAVGDELKVSGLNIAPVFQDLSGVPGKSLIDSSVAMFSRVKPVIPLDKSTKNLILGTMNMMNSPKKLEELAVVEPDLAMHVTIKVQLRRMHVEILENTTLTEMTDGHPIVKKLIDRYIAAVELRNGEKVKHEVIAALDSDIQFKQELLKYAETLA